MPCRTVGGVGTVGGIGTVGGVGTVASTSVPSCVKIRKPSSKMCTLMCV